MNKPPECRALMQPGLHIQENLLPSRKNDAMGGIRAS
jgi:hypothetical protein